MRSALLGPGSHQHLARALEPAGAFELGERLGYLRPGRLPTGLVQAGEHLVQRAERLPLEPDKSDAEASRSGAGTSLVTTSRNPAAVNASSSTPGPPRLNGSGWPGANGGSCAPAND